MRVLEESRNKKFHSYSIKSATTTTCISTFKNPSNRPVNNDGGTTPYIYLNANTNTLILLSKTTISTSALEFVSDNLCIL